MNLVVKQKSLNVIRGLAAVFAVFGFLAAPLSVLALADPADVFYVNGPLANSTVSGTVITNWRVYDNNQASVPYELTLRDTATCNNKFGTISVGSKPSSSGTDATINWASAGPINDRASIPDGKYCMVLCVSLKNGAASYAACNQRIITIRNTNIPPQITSNPPADRSIAVSESWQYQVAASDANGDSLTYSLLNAPAFISVNSGTGLISTNSAAKTAATYDITVVVRDAYGGTASQAFQLTVTPNPVNPVPPVTPTPPVTPVTPPATNQPGVVKIVSPVADLELKGNTNQVLWTSTDPDGIKQIKLSYSTDKINWLPIATLTGDKTSYNWDVSEITDESYFLQVCITDNKDAITCVVSEKFNVTNKPVDQNPNATKPLIIGVKPEDASNTSEVRPEIAGQFTPPVDSTIDPATFVLKLDDVDISTKCTVTANDFKCTLDSDLQLGVHKLHAEVKSKDDQLAIRDWTFTVVAKVVDTPPATTETGTQLNSQIIVVGLVAVCLIALLLLIPWLLYTMWRRRNQDKTDVYVETQVANPGDYSNYQDYLSAAGQPIIPEITTNYYTPEPVTSLIAAQPINISTPNASQPVTPPPAAIDSNAYVTTPDFMSYYSTPSTDSTGIENADANVPDWLKAPDTTPVANPITASVSNDVYTAPLAPAAAPMAEPEIITDVTTPSPILPADTYVAPAPVVADTSSYLAPNSDIPTSDYSPAGDFSPLPEAEAVQLSQPTTNDSTTPLAPAAPVADTGDTTTPPTDDSGSYGYGRQVDSF